MLAFFTEIDFNKLFEEAMKHGYVNSRETKILICGAAGSGKTCFRHLLLGDSPPEARTSTPLAVRPVAVHCIDTTAQWKTLSVKERKEILVKAMKNKLRHDYNNEEDSNLGNDEDPTSRVSLNDATEAHTLEAEDIVHTVTIDEELISLLPRYHSSDPVTSFQRLLIIDSGGQPEFLELIPIFMKDLSVCIFVVKLSDELSSKPDVEWCSEGEKVWSYVSDKTHKQIIHSYIQAMHCSEKASPKILVVGTHKDKEGECAETREEKNKKLADALFPLCGAKLILAGVEGEIIFGVNAMSREEEDEEVAEVIKHLISTDESPSSLAKIPQQWYALELMLEELAGSLNRGVLSLKECFDVARDKLHFDDERALVAALNHLNCLSVVFYREDILRNVVFIDPQIPFDKVTELVKQRYDLESRRSRLKAITPDMQAFYDTALVSVNFLEGVKRHYYSRIFTAVDLVELFRKLFVLAEYDSTRFFIPALLKMSTPEELGKYRVPCDSPVPPLVVEFSNNTPLQGVFCTLTCFLLSERNHNPGPWYLKRKRIPFSPPICLRRDCIQFVIPKYSHGIVTMINAVRRFEFHIASGIKNTNFQSLCSIIHKAIHEGLRSVNEDVLGYSNFEAKNAILCPCGIGDPHTASEAEGCDGEWVCSNDCLQYGELSENHKLWLHQEPGTYMHVLL